MALDRTPPLDLYAGAITPAVVSRGQEGVEIIWRARYAGRDCPGYTQREIVDKNRNIWPFLVRSRRGIFKPDKDDPLNGTVETPPLSIPEAMSAGPASYKVTQFYFCNPLQWWLNWPIIKSSPYINFEVRP
jgi:hypothetical protein